MSYIEQQRQKKQQYLREQILDKDYDAQEFTDFCETIKGDVDIDKWTFNDLVQLVSQFIKNKQTSQAVKPDIFIDFSSPDYNPFVNPFPVVATLNKQIGIDFKSFPIPVEQKIVNNPVNFGIINDSNTLSNLNTLDLDFLSQALNGNSQKAVQKNQISKQQQQKINQYNKIQNNIDSFAMLENPSPKKKDADMFKNMKIKQQTKSSISKPSPVQSTNISNKDQIKSPQLKTSVTTQNNQTNNQNMKIPSQVANQIINMSSNPQPKTIVYTQEIPQQTPQQLSTTKPQYIQQSKVIQKKKQVNESGGLKTQDQKSTNSQIMDEKLSCKKITNRPLIIHSKSTVVIQGHQIVSTNVFVPDHVVYQIKLLPGNYQVKRRFKDFDTLLNLLKKLYPANKLPHLQRYSRLSQTEPQVIKKTKYFLECFLNDLLINKELNTSRVLEQFLTIKELDHMKKKFKEYQKIEKFKSIQELSTITGEIQLKFTSKHLDYNQKFNGYLEMTQAYYQKIRQLYDQFSQSVQTSAKILVELNQAFTSLQSNTKLFNSTVQVNQFYPLERTYKYLSQINKQWSNCLKSQIKLLQTEIKPKFKFEKQNLNSIRELMKTRNNITQTYLKRADKEFERAPEKYNSKKLQQYKVGIQVPSKSLVVLKYQNAYYNNKLCSQIERMMLDLSFKLEKQYSQFSKVQSGIFGDMKTLWLDYMNFSK